MILFHIKIIIFYFTLKGCPMCSDPVVIAHEMARKGIILYIAGCEPSMAPYRLFLIALTLITGGNYVPFQHFSWIIATIISKAHENLFISSGTNLNLRTDKCIKFNLIYDQNLLKLINSKLNFKRKSMKNKLKSINQW